MGEYQEKSIIKKREELTPDVIKEMYPNGWKYLKRIERKLRSREGGKKFDDGRWYRFVVMCNTSGKGTTAIMKKVKAFVGEQH